MTEHRRTKRRIVLCLLLMAGAGEAKALAHESEAGVSLRFSAVVPAVEGLEVEARDGIAPTLTVTNATGERFEVIGRDGVAFLRIGPEVVQANLASPDWWASERPEAGAPPPATARPGAEPRWARIAEAAEWAWFEHRLDGPAAVAGADWSIPARLGARSIRLTGTWVAAQVYGVFRSTLTGVEPATDGLEVTILPGSVPGLFVENATGLALEIDDSEGRPFLRIGPEEAFLADPNGAYQRVGGTPRWGWVEPRAGWDGGDPPAALRDATEPVDVGAWSVPGRLGGREIEIRGRLEWVPVRSHHEASASANRRWPVFLGIAAAAVLIALVVRRRRG